MLADKWIAASRLDEMMELRELIHLAQDQRFREFVGLSPGTVSGDGSATVGRAGFLFVNDGSNRWREQLSGAANATTDTLARTTEHLRATSTRCYDEKRQFVVAVVPEKDIIFPKLSPNVNGSISSARTVAKLLEAVPNLVYGAALLCSESVRTYHARNSHVNFYGGLILSNAILHRLSRPPLNDDIISTEHACWPDDLSIKWVEGFNTTRRIISAKYAEMEIVKSDRHVGRQLHFQNQSARTADTLLIFGDSYSWNPDAGLARLLSYEFTEVRFVWSNKIDWHLVDKLNPSAVLLQSAERFLINGLGA